MHRFRYLYLYNFSSIVTLWDYTQSVQSETWMINWRAILGTACLWLLVHEFSLPDHQVNGFGNQGFATKPEGFKGSTSQK